MTKTHPPHYSPFGSCIQELQYAYADEGDTSKYRFGFNNQEEDSELGEYSAFEYRIHDARLGRFLSVDPLKDKYPWNSTYAFAENRVIDGIDLEGSEFQHYSNPEAYLFEGMRQYFDLCFSLFKFDVGYHYKDVNSFGTNDNNKKITYYKTSTNTYTNYFRFDGSRFFDYHGVNDFYFTSPFSWGKKLDVSTATEIRINSGKSELSYSVSIDKFNHEKSYTLQHSTKIGRLESSFFIANIESTNKEASNGYFKLGGNLDYIVVDKKIGMFSSTSSIGLDWNVSINDQNNSSDVNTKNYSSSSRTNSKASATNKNSTINKTPNIASQKTTIKFREKLNTYTTDATYYKIPQYNLRTKK